MPEQNVTNIILQLIDYRPIDSVRKRTCSVLLSFSYGLAEGKGK